MKPLKEKKTTVLLLWFSLISLAALGLPTVVFGRSTASATTYVVVTKHFGVNASEIERTITDPLENLIAELPGIKRMRSTSEFSQSRLSVALDGTISGDEFYLLLRDRVDRAYAGWPDSVQRPQVHSSTGNDDPVFIAAFTSASLSLPSLRSMIEKEVKPRIERLAGVGEVSIGGGGIREIHVEMIPDRAAGIGLTPGGVGGVLQEQHLRQPIGEFEEGRRDLTLILDGYLEDLNSVEELMLNPGGGGTVPLGTVASVTHQYREPEDVSRLDGRETVTLYVKPAGGANVVQVSQRIRREVKRLEDEGYSIEIPYDLGDQIEGSIQGVLVSLVIGMASVALFLILALPSLRIILHLTASLPLVGALTVSALAIVGVTVDQALLAGMAIGVGMMIDTALVVTDALQTGRYRFSRTAPPLMVSTLTTLIVFFPLVKASSSLPGIGPLSLAVALLLSFSLAYYLFFLPAFLRSGVEASTPFSKVLSRPPVKVIQFCSRRPLPVLAVSLALSAIAGLGVMILPRELGEIGEEGVLFARLEMESGATIDSVDKRATTIIEALRERNPGITSLESRSRPGQSQLTLRFESEQTNPKTLAAELRTLSAAVPDVFAFIPESDATGNTAVEFTLTGGDNQILRDLAKNIVEEASRLSWVKGGVLHFKENPPAYVFFPSPTSLERAGIGMGDVAGFLKWSIQGPVALKWFQGGEERDLRVFSSKQAIDALEELGSLSLTSGSGERVMLDQLGTWRLMEEPSRITHANRQRAVHFSLITDQSDLDAILRLSSEFIREANLPAGYGLFPDRALEERRGEYRSLWISLITALALIYAVLAVQGESFTAPWLVLSIVPISVAVPLLVYALTGRSLRTSTLVGLVILSGMAVNNAILILSRFKEEGRPSLNHILDSVRDRYRSLMLTTGTTLLGTLPLILRSDQGTPFTFDMALVLALGLAGSFLASITFYPALLSAVYIRRSPQE